MGTPSRPARAGVAPDLATLLATLVLLSAPIAAHAAWQPNGTPLSPPNAPMQNVGIRGLIPDGNNGAIVLWQSNQTLPDFSGSTLALIAQRVDILGNRPAPWTASGSTVRSWIDSSPSGTYSIIPLDLVDDHADGAILPMIDRVHNADYVNYFRISHITGAGAAGDVPILGGGLPVLDAAADVDGAGGVVMIGIGQTFAPPLQPLPPSPLFAQRVDGAGNIAWPGTQIVPPGQAGFSGLDAQADGAGGEFVAWIDSREVGDVDLYVQHLDGIGNVLPGWPAGGVLVCGALGTQHEPRLALDGAGGVYVLWNDNRGGNQHVFVSHLLASGAVAPGIPADGRQLSSPGNGETLVNVASDGFGGCLVVVETDQVPEALSCLSRLDGAALPMPGWPAQGVPLNTLSPGDGRVGLSGDGLGGAFVSYRNGFGSAPGQGLFAKHIGANGTPAPGWTGAGVLLSANGQESKLVRSGLGAIVAWTDTRNPGQGVYAQRLVPDGPVATQLALVSASAELGTVSLRWYAADAAALHATVERRGENTGWSPLADVTADGTGNIAYEDRTVEAGVRYGYRVTWLDGATSRRSAETWLTVPASLALALEAPRPNPANGPVRVSLALPNARGARLDVIDLAGRRVIARDLSSLGAGRHVVPIDEAASLAPGVYTLRLAQDGTTRFTRLCVVK